MVKRLKILSRNGGARLVILFWISFTLAFSAFILFTSPSPGKERAEADNKVGKTGNNRYLTPVNQVLTPAGRQVELPGMRPQVLALSPDGKLLATSGKTHQVVLIDPRRGEILQRVPLPSEKAKNTEPGISSSLFLEPDESGQVSYTGLVFSDDGSRLYLSNVNGSIKVFRSKARKKMEALFSIPLPPANAPRRKSEIPAGLALSRDASRLYVACNLSNRLVEVDTNKGQILRKWNVGVAPYEVILAQRKAYVSNWGGRVPDQGSITGPAGRGMVVRVDPVRHIASEGSVTVIDLSRNAVVKEILVGLHASGMALSPDRRYLAVANAGSDTVSVIDTKKDEVVETICVKPNPADLFGASPNALAFDKKGKTLFVANGTQNAVALVKFRPGKSELKGLIPTGWFPGAIVFDSRRNGVYVANIKGIGSTKKYPPGEKPKYNSHQYFGSLSLIHVPGKKRLKKLTKRVFENYRRPLLEKALLPPRLDQPPRPVPERVGEPSFIEHVIYIIKENRTYDQVLGDIEKGNGDPSLCVFGEEITPNQHKIVREFVLLDNTYCSGILSADGHQWSDSAFATDYMEKSFAGFPRSYPDGMGEDDVDALAYSPAGFIWDNAIVHGKSLRIYGEFAITQSQWKDPEKKTPLTFLDYYRDFVNQTGKIEIRSRPAIASLQDYLCTQTVGWDMNIPDIFRAAQFIKELKEYEKKGYFPNLVIICLPNDHTSGTRSGSPTPAAQVADNDLAFGQIVEAISHSSFWKTSCIFAIEDDPQSGWDHVNAYRTTAYVISPYVKRKTVVSTLYNQTSLLRTIELILGLPPMNQMDATADPMRECFTQTPDFTPFDALPANIPLDEMNPPPEEIKDPLARRHAVESAHLPLDQVDRCPEDLLNRIIWHAMKGTHTPYPTCAMSFQRKDKD